MDDVNRVSGGGDSTQSEMQAREALRDGEMKNRVQEMVDYRDAGELSDAELEEQKTKLRWST